MRLSVLTRKIHYWSSMTVALPLAVVVVTGLLLQMKKQVAWVQPPEQRGIGKAPSVPWPHLLEYCRKVPEAQIQSWDDIDRLDVRPSRGMVKVQAKNRWEIQLDLETGHVLQVAYRRSDAIEAIHDGSWFSDPVKWAIFVPAGLVLCLLVVTGVYMFWLPLVVKWRRKRSLTPGSV